MPVASDFTICWLDGGIPGIHDGPKYSQSVQMIWMRRSKNNPRLLTLQSWVAVWAVRMV